MAFIKIFSKTRASYKKLTGFFMVDGGSKKSINLKRASIAGTSLVLVLTLLGALMSPHEDRTYYVQSAAHQMGITPVTPGPLQSKEVQNLFATGSQRLAQEQKLAKARKRGVAAIKYFAPQIIGRTQKGPKAVKMGAKLLGFLLTTIDTREPSMVSVVLPQGGVSDSGFEIERNSILIGNFAYRGEGNKVSLVFSRLDTPDGDSIKISAIGLDASDYTAGVRGTIYSDDGVKVASSIGLTMAASMTDVLTAREALGNSFGPAQAKPTMQNALLQGVSHAAQDQAGRISGEINSVKDYVVIPKGKEIIVQLNQDLKHE